MEVRYLKFEFDHGDKFEVFEVQVSQSSGVWSLDFLGSFQH